MYRVSNQSDLDEVDRIRFPRRGGLFRAVRGASSAVEESMKA